MICLSLKEIKNSEQLAAFMFEGEVDLRCKETGLSVVLIEPTEEEGEALEFVLSDGSEVEFPAEQLGGLFEAASLIEQ